MLSSNFVVIFRYICSSEYVFLKISQYSQEKKPEGAATLLKKEALNQYCDYFKNSFFLGQIR